MSLPVIPNDSMEQEKKEFQRLMRAVKRSNKKVSGNLRPTAPIDYSILNNDITANQYLMREEVKEETMQESKVSSRDYIINFLAYRIAEGKKEVMEQRLLHAADDALLVSDDQVDAVITQNPHGRKRFCKTMSDALDCLLKENIIETCYGKPRLFRCKLTKEQAQNIINHLPKLEKTLAYNINLAYTKLESGQTVDLSQLIDTVYTIKDCSLE